jgi:hypothetical protein
MIGDIKGRRKWEYGRAGFEIGERRGTDGAADGGWVPGSCTRLDGAGAATEQASAVGLTGRVAVDGFLGAAFGRAGAGRRQNR